MGIRSANTRRCALLSKMLSAVLCVGLAGLAGCGGDRTLAANAANATFALSPDVSIIDTNCTGCNGTNAHGAAVHQFKATLTNGGPAAVKWSLSGGDAIAGTGSISTTGQYTPPSFLSADQVEVFVTATLIADPAIRATSSLTLTPGFLQPLTPENVALGANGTVTVTGYLAEAGGSSGIRFALSDSATGTNGGQGTLSATNCARSSHAFTSCSVNYTAPPAVSITGITYLVASASHSSSKTEAAILLNPAGIVSDPMSHQSEMATPIQLGASGGNNNDFDAQGDTIADCCSGTLGSMVQDNSGRQYLLSNNHVLARSDHAAVGDAIVQPGLIDNNCTPNGEGPGTAPVAALTTWLPLHSATTNVDAAIAQIGSHSVSQTGSILELGSRQPDGSLADAPPGTSSSGGKGEAASLQMRVAKSGRTTGLTCGDVSALYVDVSVDYYRDCAETKPYLTKTFSNQVAVSGDRFSDAGDSGALIVDTANAEPVGLFFAGGIDASGVGQGMANPAGEVLSELSAQAGSGIGYTFVGSADHGVSCLSYGDSTASAAQTRSLSDAEVVRGMQGLAAARSLVNPASGILGVAMGKSTDRPGEAAVIIYVDEKSQPAVPASVDGVRTVVIPTNAHAVAFGTAPLTNVTGPSATSANGLSVSNATFTQALAVKRRRSRGLMLRNPSFFGVGVGQSLDNPQEAALVIYVDRRKLPTQLPANIDGVRTRFVVMVRLHVTRSYAAPFKPRRHCMPHTTSRQLNFFDPALDLGPRKLDLN